MDIIVLHEGVYTLESLDWYDFNFSILNCFEYCNAFREAMSDYNERINKWVMRDGRYFFGCICD